MNAVKTNYVRFIVFRKVDAFLSHKWHVHGDIFEHSSCLLCIITAEQFNSKVTVWPFAFWYGV
jgi:hypothetical protein